MNSKYSHFIMDQLEIMIDQTHGKHQKLDEEAKLGSEIQRNEKSLIAFKAEREVLIKAGNNLIFSQDC